MKSENNMRKSEKTMPKASSKEGHDNAAFSGKTAPKGKSHSTGKSKNPATDLRGLHAAGKTVSTWNSERSARLEGSAPKNKSR
jgi:hypothetical protein